MNSFEDKISLMIPAYLRGELSEEERQEIENLAAINPEIAADIEFQKNLKASLTKDENAYEPGDLGWAKLSKAMEDSEKSNGRATAQPKFWRYTAAILAVAAIGQAGVLGSLAFSKSEDAQYVTASEAPSDKAYSTKVAFDAELTMSKLTETLQTVDGVIIEGPSSLGLYKVRFKSEASCKKAIENFQLWSDLVETVSSCD